MKDARNNQEKHLQELVGKDKTNGERANALGKIQRYEQSRWQYQKIHQTLHRLKGGLTRVDVLILNNDGKITEWKSVTNPETHHATVAKRNEQHPHQVAPTPFDHGEGHWLLHGTDRHKTFEDILQGTLEQRHPMEEVKNWASQLKLAYDPDTLITEANEINKYVLEEEFCHYFGGKPERTELLPSLQHIGHYKTMPGSDNLWSVLW